MKNLEIKARCGNWRRIVKALGKLGARRLAPMRQIDTYFRVPAGRLKLRQFNSKRAELIYYRRPEGRDQRWSDYTILPAAPPARWRGTLEKALGVKAVVDKRRIVYLHRNARIHLDNVKGIGRFVEIEVVVRKDAGQARRVMAELLQAFGIPRADFIRQSYSDMNRARK